MTPENFCYWLNGYIELAEADGTPNLSKEKLAVIKNHLGLMLTKRVYVPLDSDVCHGCSGSGKVLNHTCGVCRGTGVLNE